MPLPIVFRHAARSPGFPVVLVACALLVAARAGQGQTPPSPARQAADLYHQAERLLDEDTAKAAELLGQSVAAKPSARAYLLLGNAYLRLHRIEEAEEVFGRYLELAPNSRQKKRVEDQLKELHDSFSARLVLSSEPPGATIYVDYKADGIRGKTPLELRVRPGRHRVYFELEGYDAVQVKDVPVKAEERKAVHQVLQVKGCDVAVSAAPARVSLKLDDKDVAALPAVVRVAPGSHTLVLSGSELVTKTLAVECRDFQPLVVTETLVAAKPLPPPPDRLAQLRAEQLAAAQKKARHIADQQRILLGVGIATGAAAVGLEGLALGARLRLRQADFGSPPYNQLRRLERIGLVSGGGAAAVAIGSFIAYGVLEHRREALGPGPGETRKTALRTDHIGPWLLPGGAGVSWGGRF